MSANNCCNYEGCTESEYLVECHYPDDGSSEDTLAGLYCYTHAPEQGFCFGCGQFWGGVESFEFAEFWGGVKGYCENCSFEIRSDCGELDDDDCYAYWGVDP